MIKNKYETNGDITTLFVTRKNGDKFVILIDTEDLKIIYKLDHSIYVDYSDRNDEYYAKITEYLGKINGEHKYTTRRLTRLILGITDKRIVIDHINRNTLDNRKKNLRPTTITNNTKNRKGNNSNNKLGHRNIIVVDNKYIVQIQVDGKCTRMGSFNNIEDAITCAEEMRQTYYGEFSGIS
jgi:hypothetical protein